MLFEIYVETKGKRYLDDTIADASARVFYLSEVVASVLKTLFHVMFVERDPYPKVKEALANSKALSLHDLRTIVVYDPVYEWSEAEAAALWRPPLMVAQSVRRLAKAFHREEPFARWLLEQTFICEMATPRAKLEAWFERTKKHFVLCARDGDWLDYIAHSLERLAIVLRFYHRHEEIRLRIHPDIPDLLRRTFRPGTFANPGLTDEEWAEWDEEKDEER